MIDAAALLGWYRTHGRAHLPWRRTRDPYRVLVSEIMLQQTQVERVLPVFTAFVERFADFDALAAASRADVVRAWRGLGYNSRAVRLHELARAVVERWGGRLPSERADLLALPGIGPYTAAAIRAFAFDANDAAMDTNVRRIVHRTLFGIEHPPRANGAALDAAAAAAVPHDRGHDWNSAMMDVGALICTARAPKCLLCPLRSGCVAAPVDAAALARLVKAHARRSPQEALPFERTARFLRGRIIDRLRDAHHPMSLERLQHDLAGSVPPERIADVPATLDALVRDGVIDASDRGIALRTS